MSCAILLRGRPVDLGGDAVRRDHGHLRRAAGPAEAPRPTPCPAVPERRRARRPRRTRRPRRERSRRWRSARAPDEARPGRRAGVSLGEEPLEQRPHRADERERGEHRDLARPLRRLRRDEEGREQSDPDRVHPARGARAWDRHRVGDHEEEEDQDLGRGHEEPPEGPAGDRPEVPARGHRMPARREDGDAGREREPEPDGDEQQPEPGEDGESAHDDEGERQRHPDRHRPPPEVERLRARLPECEEAEDEPEVRGVEEMPALEADEVLREERHRRRRGEDPPAVHAPPVAVLRARHAQDEGDPVSRQERARRPQEDPWRKNAIPTSSRAHVPSETRIWAIERLNPNNGLPEHLQRDDHHGEMQARIPDRGQQDGVAPSPDRHHRPAGEGGRAHGTVMVLPSVSGRASPRSSPL